MAISRNINRSSVVLGLCALTAVGQGGPAAERVHYSEVHMGVQVSLTVYAPSREAADEACRAAFARIAELEDVMSDYRPDSELSRLCAQAGGPPVEVGDDLLTVLSRAHALAERSGGAFDATVGPYVQLWRLARKSGNLPTDDEWQAAGKLVGYGKMHLDMERHTVQLGVPGMRLDLGGIAKGYALDQALATLREHGTTRALASAGGDIALGDPPPGREGWRIRVWEEDEKRGHHTNSADVSPNWYGVPFVSLHNCGISTSGDTEQFVEIDGKHYSHIIDPRCGLRYGEPILATVIAPDAMTSDSLATACVVLGEEAARKLVEATPEATVYVRRADGR